MNASDAALILAARRAELQTAIGGRDLIAVERHADAVDHAYGFAAREVGAAELAKLTGKLAAVGAAIARLADGTYGVCVDCDEPIPVRRLAAVPEASRCVRCQEVHEAQAAVAIAAGAELEEEVEVA